MRRPQTLSVTMASCHHHGRELVAHVPVPRSGATRPTDLTGPSRTGQAGSLPKAPRLPVSRRLVARRLVLRPRPRHCRRSRNQRKLGQAQRCRCPPKRSARLTRWPRATVSLRSRRPRQRLRPQGLHSRRRPQRPQARQPQDRVRPIQGRATRRRPATRGRNGRRAWTRRHRGPSARPRPLPPRPLLRRRRRIRVARRRATALRRACSLPVSVPLVRPLPGPPRLSAAQPQAWPTRLPLPGRSAAPRPRRQRRRRRPEASRRASRPSARPC